jgi:hypothetical protein
MMIAEHPRGHVAVGQPAHAWLSGQLARAWGNQRFGPVSPREEVCLAAEQHDIGMAEWDLAPTLDVLSGLPTSFMAMDVETHLRLWTEGPAKLVAQSRYAALLVSMHGSALYALAEDRQDLTADQRVAIRDFLELRRAFDAEIRDGLDVTEAEIDRNRRLVSAWDGLSLALVLEWNPWTAVAVPTSRGERLDLRLTRGPDDHHTLTPWPFAQDRVTVRTEGRLLDRCYGDQEAMRAALAGAPWIDLNYELRRR